MLRELTQVAQTIKQSADSLQSSTHDKIVGLIKDKVATKKYYVDNRERIDSELLKVLPMVLWYCF